MFRHSALLAVLSPPERLKILEQLDADEQAGALRLLSPLASLAHPAEAFPGEARDHSPLTVRLIDIVATLYGFETAAEELLTSGCNPYLLGDSSVSLLMQETTPAQASDHLGSRCLEVLAVVGCLYRFTVAAKFGYKDHRIMQLRLNGWGRALAQDRELRRSERFVSALHFTRAALVPHRARYEELLALCGAAARPLETTRIHRLNTVVPIPLVS